MDTTSTQVVTTASASHKPEKLIVQHGHRIPSLDGIRAIAILLVILLHSVQEFSSTGHPGYAWLNSLIPDGVGIFFVLSGFLITTLLLGEYEKLRPSA